MVVGAVLAIGMLLAVQASRHAGYFRGGDFNAPLAQVALPWSWCWLRWCGWSPTSPRTTRPRSQKANMMTMMRTSLQCEPVRR